MGIWGNLEGGLSELSFSKMIGFREGHAVCSEGIQDRVPSSFHSESLFHFEDHEHLKNDEEKISGESNYILLPLAYPWQ